CTQHGAQLRDRRRALAGMLRLCRVENAAELRTAVGRSGACLAESPLERRAQDLGELGGRVSRNSVHLQLDTTVLTRKLELPDVRAILQPPAKLDSEPEEKPIAGVVVGRRERAWLDRLAAKVVDGQAP